MTVGRRAALRSNRHRTEHRGLPRDYISGAVELSNKRPITINRHRTQRSAAVIQDVNNMLSNSPPTDHATAQPPGRSPARPRGEAADRTSCRRVGGRKRRLSDGRRPGRALSRRPSDTLFVCKRFAPCFANKLQPGRRRQRRTYSTCPAGDPASDGYNGPRCRNWPRTDQQDYRRRISAVTSARAAFNTATPASASRTAIYGAPTLSAIEPAPDLAGAAVATRTRR